MSDYTLQEAAELLTEAKAQVLELTKKMSTAGYSAAQKSVTRQQLGEAREHLEWCRSLYNSLSGGSAGRTLARPRSGA